MTLDGRRTVSRRNSPLEVSRSRESMAGDRMQLRAIRQWNRFPRYHEFVTNFETQPMGCHGLASYAALRGKLF